VAVRDDRDPSGGWVWLKVYYCLFLLGGAVSIVGQLHVCRVAVVGGGCCVENVVFTYFGQPRDGLHTGPKHVVVYYIILYIATNCNIVVFMTVCIYRYIHTTALFY
jgi:hypothetical protein